MLSRFFNHVVICGTVSIVTAVAGQPERLACNSETIGQLWPSQANGNNRLTRKLFNCGELQVCTRGRWKYRWSPLSVRVDQLSGGSKVAPPACTALINELATPEQVQPASGKTGTGQQGLTASVPAEAAR
jgi:hypothetical protein